jgi:hypothetical protein
MRPEHCCSSRKTRTQGGDLQPFEANMFAAITIAACAGVYALAVGAISI